MLDNEYRDQMSLFAGVVEEKSLPQPLAESLPGKEKNSLEASPAKEVKQEKRKPVGVEPMRKKQIVKAVAEKPKSVSGLVPSGDVRLTANIREDLHLKLKIAAARRRTTIGEIIEELVEMHV
jgi:uncharacterized protein YajQ (UPF0234 family)